MTLNVYFGQNLAGRLFSTDNRGVVFAYDTEYLSASTSRPLSLSLPLREQEFSQRECIPFFAGLLPEEDFVVLSQQIGISPKTIFDIFADFAHCLNNAKQILYKNANIEKSLCDEIIDFTVKRIKVIL